jgi:hypothetical protein
MAFNWSTARSGENLCGWCIGSPPSANCDGRCFQDGACSTAELFKRRKKFLKNRKKYLKSQLNEVKAELKKMS